MRFRAGGVTGCCRLGARLCGWATRSWARCDEADPGKADLHKGLEDTLTITRHALKHHVTVCGNYGNIPPIARYQRKISQESLIRTLRQRVSGSVSAVPKETS